MKKYDLLLLDDKKWKSIDSYENSAAGEYDEKEGLVGKAYRLYDSSSGNVHMRPLDKQTAEDCSNAIQEKLDIIKKEFDKRGIKTRIYTENARAKKPDKYKNATHIFDYIRYVGEKGVYQITGILFYKANNNGVECIYEKLCAVQFVRTSNEIKSRDIYPQGDEENTFGDVGVRKEVYFNPHCSFASSAEQIVDEFMLFVCKCDN